MSLFSTHLSGKDSIHSEWDMGGTESGFLKRSVFLLRITKSGTWENENKLKKIIPG